MAFPTGTVIPTANLDAGTDSPASARADLLETVQAVNSIIASANGNNGVCVLGGGGKLPNTVWPTSITCTGTQIINPSEGIVNIRDVLRLQAQTTADIEALVDPVAGDLAYASDGAGGSPCIAFYNGTDWVRISVGAAISAT